MKFAWNLYTTKKTKKHLPLIMNHLRKHRFQPDVWLITLASNQDNLLDIFQSVYYMHPMIEKLNPDIVGIAESEDAAKDLVLKMVEEVQKQNGNFDMRAYFKFQE